MQTLAQILAGAGGNPYQPASPGGGISPLVQQLLLANQMGGPQLGEQDTMGVAGGVPNVGIPGQQQMIPGQPMLPQGFGSTGQAAALNNGLY
jgi:hypothetical protein